MFKRLIFTLILGLVAFLPVIAQDAPPANFAQSLGSPAVDEGVLNDRRYMRVEGGADVFDAPNGNVVRTLSPGYVFLTTRRDNGGWSEINTGEYVRTSALTNVPKYT